MIELLGSTKPTFGLKYLWAIPDLAFILIRSKMATPVVSLPVPPVVGIATRGYRGPGTGVPDPIGAFTYVRNSAGCVV